MHKLVEQMMAISNREAKEIEGIEEPIFFSKLTVKQQQAVEVVSKRYHLGDEKKADNIGFMKHVMVEYITDAEGAQIFEEDDIDNLPMCLVRKLLDAFQAVNEIDDAENLEKK